MYGGPGESLQERLANRFQESEDVYQSLFGLSADPAFCLDVDGRIVSGNAALEVLTGRADEDLVGVPLSTFIADSDADRVQRHFARALAGQPQTFECSGHTSDGREFVIMATLVPLTEGDEMLGVYGTAKDVTPQREAERALRESEERYRLLADHAMDLISLHDLEGRFIYASPAAHRVLGYHPVELIGRSVYEFVHAEDVAALQAAHETVLTRTGRSPLTFRGIRADGTEGWFESTARVAVSEDGSPPRIVAMTRDVSERRHLEQQLGQMQKLDAVGRVASGLAHDFNNLLTIVLGRTESLLDRVPPDDAMTRELEEIRVAAQRSVGLITQMLAVGRRETGTPVSLDLNGAVLEFLPLLTRLAGTQAELATDLDAELWPIRADATQIEQVLLNLVVNARDALGSEHGSITVTTRNVQLGGPAGQPQALLPPGEYVVLSVHDTGCGMDDGTAAEIFEPFFTTKPDGTGLGLATVHAIAQAAGGDVTVESRRGVGTTFRIFLPRDRSPAALVEDDARGEETILLVEDEHDERVLMQAILERHGYHVHAVGSAAEALALAADLRQAPDLLLTDVMLAELKGPELALRLRERFPGLPTLYITGYSDDAVLRLGIRDDTALLVQKPFTAALLARTVRSALIMHGAWQAGR